MSPFMACNGFQPPLFPDQEREVAAPAVKDHLHRIREVCKTIKGALTRSAERNKRLADLHPRTVLDRKCGCRRGTSLSRWSLVSLPPDLWGRFNLLASMNVHPTFHVSLLRHPPSLIDGHPAFTISRILDIRPWGCGF
ncbi:uncharacterized protein LOC144039673 [Vanacampus margaritifer]